MSPIQNGIKRRMAKTAIPKRSFLSVPQALGIGWDRMNAKTIISLAKYAAPARASGRTHLRSAPSNAIASRIAMIHLEVDRESFRSRIAGCDRERKFINALLVMLSLGRVGNALELEATLPAYSDFGCKGGLR